MTTIQSVELLGERYVLIPARDYALFLEGEGALPPLPIADARGAMPAMEFSRVDLARGIILERRSLGLTQRQLGKLAGVRMETISRLESGKHKANIGTVEKIDRALKRAASRRRANAA